LEFHRGIIADPGQQQQSPRDGTWLEFHRAIDTQPTVLQFLAIAVHRATKRKRFFNRGTSRNKTQTVLNRGARDTRRAGLLGTWLEFDRVIIAEPGQQQQSPRDGNWLEFDRGIDVEPVCTVFRFTYHGLRAIAHASGK
jgi:hypothetical protein